MMPLPPPAFNRDWLAACLLRLSEHGIFIGTSSWKYEGWVGRLYSRERYLTRGRFSRAKFERECLAEHAEIFSTVCVDAGYYRFPSPDWIQQLMEATPDCYRFTFKVTDDITARTFPNLPRHGEKAGQRNEHFLDADLFQQAFLNALSPYQDRTGVLIFEFSHFHPRDFARGLEFVEALDGFLKVLPKGWRYGVEVRNRSLLQPEYFATLRRHGVAHVFNQWTKMPGVSGQLQLHGSSGCADFCAARFLLRQGRTFEQAVQKFSPYDSVKEPFPEAREAIVSLIRKSVESADAGARPKLFLYINNRLEGNALETILAVLLQLGLFEHGIPLSTSVPMPVGSPP